MTVPLGELPTCMDAICSAMKGILPGLRVHGFGQLDGEMRVRLLPPRGQPGFGGCDLQLIDALERAVRACKGRLVGSDGCPDPVPPLPDAQTTIDLSVMRDIKSALDVRNILDCSS